MAARMMCLSLLVLLVPSLTAGLSVDPPSLGSYRGSSSQCREALCHQVRQEAEGLARIKLLRGYVTETVKLLDSLMLSMDQELVELGQEMNQAVASNDCPGVQSLIAQITQPLKVEDQALSAGIMEESTALNLEQQQSPLSVDVAQARSDDLSSGIVQSADEERNDREDSWTSYSSREAHSSTNSGGRPSWGSSSHSNRGRKDEGIWRSDSFNQIDSNWDDDRDDRYGGSTSGGASTEDHSWSSNRRGSSSSRYDSGSTSHSHGYRKGHHHHHSSRETAGSGRQLDGSSGSHGWSPIVTGPTCRGVSGSPYAVPGIDQWCQDNCPRGYCPTTHCICE